MGRALVARHENEVQFAELIYSGDRLLTRATEQVNTYQDFLRAPAPIRLQLYRAAQQAVADQLAALRDTAAARPDLAPDVARLVSVAERWDAELGWVSRDGPQPSERVLAEATRLSARADELGREYAEAVAVYQGTWRRCAPPIARRDRRSPISSSSWYGPADWSAGCWSSASAWSPR